MSGVGPIIMNERNATRSPEMSKILPQPWKKRHNVSIIETVM